MIDYVSSRAAAGSHFCGLVDFCLQGGVGTLFFFFFFAVEDEGMSVLIFLQQGETKSRGRGR